MLEEENSVLSLATFIENSEFSNVFWIWYPAEDLVYHRYSISRFELGFLRKYQLALCYIISLKYLFRTTIIFQKFGIMDVTHLGKKMAERYIN